MNLTRALVYAVGIETELNISGDMSENTTDPFQDGVGPEDRGSGTPDSNSALIVILSLFFCAIVFIGICGNAIVIFAILSDVKMRRSGTNLFILNLAIADLLIMLFGIPEIVQFGLDKGWLMGLLLCRINRYVLVVSLYASIQTLVAVCVERYIAIVHPIKAHIVCSRRRILSIMMTIWVLSCAAGSPTALFNQLTQAHPGAHLYCRIVFPGNAAIGITVFKLIEFVLFFFVPVVLQIVLYTIISRQLFTGTKSLHRPQTISTQTGACAVKESNAIRMRKGVVKMLIATVIVYVISYTPAQLPLFYNMLSGGRFQPNFAFIVLVMTLAYINSAANPVLYGIFSQKFRQKFQQVLCKCRPKRDQSGNGQSVSMDSVQRTLLTSQNNRFKVKYTVPSQIPDIDQK